MIDFICPGACRCNYRVSVPDEMAGCPMACPRSGQRVTVPGPRLSAATWPAFVAPQPMLLQMPAVSERKLRLFAVACCQRIANVLGSDGEALLAVAERHADGLASDRQLRRAANRAEALIAREMDRSAVISPLGYRSVPCSFLRQALTALRGALGDATPRTVGEAAEHACRADLERNWRVEKAVQARLLRDIVPNPYDLPVLVTDWLTWDGGAVLGIARTIYDEKRFEDMPILADALEEAGCTDVAILDHCRSPGPHACGCWLLDLILGKT